MLLMLSPCKLFNNNASGSISLIRIYPVGMPLWMFVSVVNLKCGRNHTS